MGARADDAAEILAAVQNFVGSFSESVYGEQVMVSPQFPASSSPRHQHSVLPVGEVKIVLFCGAVDQEVAIGSVYLEERGSKKKLVFD